MPLHERWHGDSRVCRRLHLGKDMGEIDEFVQSMQQGSENFVLTDEGSIDKFLGIEIKRLGKQEFEISQPFLIDRILALLQLEHHGFETDSNDKLTPVAPDSQQRSDG